MPDGKPVIMIDGAAFHDYEGFGREFSNHLDSDQWSGNLDAFNDILRGGFGTPDGGFVFRWVNSAAPAWPSGTRPPPPG
jgi:RNAse (barnase) inhibitor barstar